MVFQFTVLECDFWPIHRIKPARIIAVQPMVAPKWDFRDIEHFLVRWGRHNRDPLLHLTSLFACLTSLVMCDNLLFVTKDIFATLEVLILRLISRIVAVQILLSLLAHNRLPVEDYNLGLFVRFFQRFQLLLGLWWPRCTDICIGRAILKDIIEAGLAQLVPDLVYILLFARIATLHGLTGRAHIRLLHIDTSQI